MSRSKHRWIVALLALGIIAAGTGLGIAWHLFMQSGRTATEILDYADKRMDGHDKIEFLARPLMQLLRARFDAQPLSVRISARFDVPPPPQRRGPQAVPPPPPAPEGARVWRVGPHGAIASIREAVQRATDGDIVEIEAGDYFGEVASWPQKRLTIRGVGGAARLFAAGQVAEGKAIWVIRHGEFDISDVDFIGARANDGNGAGIRLEAGHLRLHRCLFWDNQMGLMTAGLPHAKGTSLEIYDSEFAYSHVDRKWGHNLYVGAIDHLKVVGSYFHHASRGHLLKSRAAVNEVLYSRLTDEAGGYASYEANFPNGGRVLMLGNVVQQQSTTENGIIVSYGEEGYTWHENRLVLASNTLVNDLRHGGMFLRVASGTAQVVTRHNLLVGEGGYLAGNRLDASNDVHAEWKDLAEPAVHDYRLRLPAARFLLSADEPVPLGVSLPTAQYLHPRSVLTLAAPPTVVGADQRPGR